MKTSQLISTVLASIGLISAIQVFLSYKWLMAILEPLVVHENTCSSF